MGVHDDLWGWRDGDGTGSHEGIGLHVSLIRGFGSSWWDPFDSVLFCDKDKEVVNFALLWRRDQEHVDEISGHLAGLVVLVAPGE